MARILVRCAAAGIALVVTGGARSGDAGADRATFREIL